MNNNSVSVTHNKNSIVLYNTKYVLLTNNVIRNYSFMQRKEKKNDSAKDQGTIISIYNRSREATTK